MRNIRPGRLLLAMLPAALSCSDPVAPRIPTSVTIVSGTSQTAQVMSLLPQPIIVEVRDVDGKSIRGIDVTWTVTNGGGAVSAATTTTDRLGQAQVQWTLGASSGQQRLNASVPDVAPAVVVAMAESAPPAALEVVSGADQIGLVDLRLARRIRVRVTDEFGNRIGGVPVMFTAVDGAVSPASEVSNSNGLVQTEWTLGSSVGEQTLDVGIAGDVTIQVNATALTPDDITQLENGQPVTGLEAALGQDAFFRVPLPPSVVQFVITLDGFSQPQDPDLYVLNGALPSTGAYSCIAATLSSVESCAIPTPEAGDWYVLIDAYSAYSDASLTASYVVGGDIAVDVTGLPQGANAGLMLTGDGSFTRTIDSTDTVTALMPGSYTITAYNVIDGTTVYTTTPSSRQVNVVSGGVANVAVTYGVAIGLNLDITDVHITQSVQRTNGSVPLIAGRDGLLRVLARASELNTATPDVRVRIYQNGGLVDTRTISAPAGSVPVVNDEGDLASTWNVAIPGSLIQPGMSVLVDVDPDDVVTETNESDNTYPTSAAPLELDVRVTNPMLARLVPIRQSNDSVGDVTEANAEDYVTMARAIYPFSGIDVDVREPLTFTGTLPAQYDTVWGRLLGELLGARTLDESDRYYFGVVSPSYTSGGTGLGYLGLPAALGIDIPAWRAPTLAHEWGHNFNRRHVDCGSPSGPDPDYPHTERPGALGRHGWDMRTNTIVSADTHQDIMSYCQPYWASDYTYEAVLDYREAEATGAAEPSVLIWGRISPDGVVIEPAFEVVTRPKLPRGRGPYRLTATDAQGATVLDISFAAYEIDHLPGVRHFAWAIPLRTLRGPLHELRLRGAGVDGVRRQSQPVAVPGAGDEVRVTRDGVGAVRLQWDATRNPVILVRDPHTRAVLSFARGGDVRIATDAAEVEVNVSNGVRSSAHRVMVR